MAGFDRNPLSASGGLGLIMMRERAGQLNGTFEFETAPGRGTVIRVEIPFRWDSSRRRRGWHAKLGRHRHETGQ